MKSTKSITAVIVFVAAFAFSSGLVWLFVGFPVHETPSTFTYQSRSESPSADDIDLFLNTDIRNGRERSRKMFAVSVDQITPLSSATFPNYSAAVADYVENSDSLDASDFPADFQAAWHKHMKAWRDYSNFLNNLKSNPARRKVSDKDFSRMETSFNDNINSTWYEVLRVSSEYTDGHGY